MTELLITEGATEVPVQAPAVAKGSIECKITADRAGTQLLWVRHCVVRDGAVTIPPTIAVLDLPRVLGGMAKRRVWLHVTHGADTTTTPLQLIRA